MIRKHLYTLYVMKRRQEIAQPDKILILIRNTRNEHMSDPYRFVYLTQISGTIQNIGVTMTRQFAMLLIIYVLDIKQHRIGKFHQTLKLLEER